MTTIDLLDPEYQRQAQEEAAAATAAITNAKIAIDLRIAELEDEQAMDYAGIAKMVIQALKFVPIPEAEKVILSNAVDLVTDALGKHWE